MRSFFSVVIVASVLGLSAISDARQQVQRLQIPDSLLPSLRSSRVVGTPAPSDVLHLAIGVKPRFPAELKAFCDSVSDPQSPMYRHYMTPQQVGETFGASASDVNGVVSYLKSQGMKVTLSSPNRMAILVDCTVAQAQTAFSTQIKNYQAVDGGQTIVFHANATPLSVPATVPSIIESVSGVNDFARPKPMTTLTPPLARALYATAPSYATGTQGQGRKIAYSNWVNYKLSDASVFISAYGLPVPAGGAGSNIHVVKIGSGHTGNTASGEGNLDMCMLLAAAPLADIYIYDSTGSLLGVLTQEAADNTADVISESYGWSGITGTTGNSCHNQHLSMTAQGQTYLCASGDAGTAGLYPVDPGHTTNANYYPYPDVDPDVLSIGGTIATVNTTTGARISETVWSGGGGGWSPSTEAFNILPSYQHGTGVPTNLNYKLVPDVSMHAASSGNAFNYAINGAISAVSGTSCSSPFFTSCLATLEQRLAANGWPNNGRLGRMNDLIYSENGRSDVWFDVTSGNNGGLPDGTTSSARSGWDFGSGWGTPNFDNWYTVLATKTVTGNVTLQNYAGAVSGIQVTVQFYQAGTSTLVDTQVASLDAGGNFLVTTTAPVGSYDVYLKTSHWLRRKVSGKSLTTTGASGLAYSLTNGDINGDNAVTLGDFANLRAAYGSSAGDANWNANADLNGDGAITLGDFAVLRSNYGTMGD